MTKRHGNFQDPIGLVRRMLRSRDPAARAALWREALRYVVMPLDWVLGRWEQRRLARSAPEDHPPIVLIIGSPRSGSTLLYQVLSGHLPVSYPTNLTELFPRSPITASMRFGGLTRAKRSYRSYYGNTPTLGSPNDGFSLWNRWLGSDRYRVPDEMPAETAADMRSFFSAWGAAFEGPFLNKNNRNTAAVRLLAAQLPTARFIVTRRDPVFVAQSLLEAREAVQGDRAVGWGLAAEDSMAGDHLAEVADQVLRIESMLAAQLARVDSTRVLEVGYSEVCADPGGVVSRVADWLGLEPHALEQLSPFESTDERRLGIEEFAQLEDEIGRRLSD